MRKLSAFCVAFLLVGCASNLDEPEFDLDSVVLGEQDKIASEFVAGTSGGVEWYSCHGEKLESTFAVLNLDDQPFSGNPCQGWLSQSFLRAGFNVIGINRPGYGKSSGGRSFGGPAAVAGILKALDGAQKKLSWFSGQPQGIWGFQIGGISAAFASRKLKNTKWLIIGNGYYDLEEFMAQKGAAAQQKELKKAMGQADEAEFFEQRSIAWDSSGLPGFVLLYHGLEGAVNLVSCHSFKDSLASEETNVDLLEIKKGGYQLDKTVHQAILKNLLTKVKKAEKTEN